MKRLRLITLLVLVGLVPMLTSLPYADAQVITYKIHPDIHTELRDRYPNYADEYWEDVRNAIRDGINDWLELNPNLIFTPTHDDEYDVVIEWIDSSTAWGVEYHDHSATNHIGIDFDTPEPDAYGASLMNPDIIRYVMAHELGHTLGLGHTSKADHLMYGLSHPKPDKVFDDMGYVIPHVVIEDFENVGGNKLDIAFHMSGYTIYDVETMVIDDTPYVVVATGEDGVFVVNMTNVDAPGLAGSYDIHTTDTESLEGWPYLVILHDEGINILNMTDPTNIKQAFALNLEPGRAALAEIDGHILMLTTGGPAVIQQYDVTDPYNTQRTGGYYDDFVISGVGIQIHLTNDNTYALVTSEASVFLLSVDRAPTLIRQDVSFGYDSTIETTLTVGDDEYRILYWNDQILVHEPTSSFSSDPIGRLLGYDVHEIDGMKIGSSVYAVIAAGDDGVFGIHIGDEAVGKWTFN